MVRKLNELYKTSVVSCQSLSLRLQRFFLDKQRLLDRIQSVTAEKLIFSHAVQTVRPTGPRVGRSWESGPRSGQGCLMATALPDCRERCSTMLSTLPTSDTQAPLQPQQGAQSSPELKPHSVTPSSKCISGHTPL